MKTKLVLATTWVMSEPNRLHAIIIGTLVLLGIVASATPNQIALADGSAPGGSRG